MTKVHPRAFTEFYTMQISLLGTSKTVAFLNIHSKLPRFLPCQLTDFRGMCSNKENYSFTSVVKPVMNNDINN